MFNNLFKILNICIQDENGDENDSEYYDGDNKSVYGVTADEDSKPSKPLQSLNPLPPEMINRNFEHEQSAEPTTGGEEAETGASSNADVEDNDIDERHFDSAAADDKGKDRLISNKVYRILIFLFW